MITDLLRYIFWFILMLLLQVVFLNNVQLGGLVNPFLYIAFIMVLPVRIPGVVLLLIAFMLGLIIDMFSNTMGMHAAACVFMAYARPAVLKLIAPRDGYDAESAPSIREQGIYWFVVYVAIMTLLHHLLLFYIEVFRLTEFFSTLARVLLSSVATTAVILITQFLIEKPSSGK